MPRPFQISVPDSVLDDLRERLARTRWPDALPNSGWDYGADVEYVRALCEYWRTQYDWRRHEAELNRYPQFLHGVDGVDLHYYHVRGGGPAPFPLLLVHGWPGSVYEFHHLIGPLTDPGAFGADPSDAFDVVVPALPGFGFGGKPRERGWGISRIAAAFDRLMADLGYTHYGVQGGDWGAIVAAKMGSAHAGRVAGIHLNMAISPPLAGAADDEAERPFVEARDAFQAAETGYSNVQRTKPQSLAVAQSDSPAGLAAWITEKFRTWSDCNGDLESVYTKDQLLTNIMFYWAPNSVASSARIYYEASRDPASFAYPPVSVPTAVADFPKEIYRAPRSWLEPRYNLKRYTSFERGGHFAALEQPAALLEDVRAFFRTLR